MTEEGRQPVEQMAVKRKDDDSEPSFVSKFVDGAVIITFITASGYLVGYSYFYSFFGRLSIPNHAIILSAIEYMYQAFLMFFIVAVAVFPAALVAKEKPLSFPIALIGNLPVFAFVAIGIISSVRSSNWLAVIGAIFVGLVTLDGSYKRRSLAHYVYMSSIRGVVAALGAMTMLAMLSAFIMGEVNATKLIEGNLHYATVVELFDESGQNFLGNDEYILVLMDSQSYYLVKKQSPAPKNPTILVVTRDEVKTAKIRKVN